MIYHVKSDSPDGKLKAGDQLSAAQFAEIKNTSNVHHVLQLPDDAAGRLKMRDVAPNKPLGSAPDVEDATVGFSEDAGLPSAPPTYMGGAEAMGIILNPSAKERAESGDVHPDAKSPDVKPGKAGETVEIKAPK